MRYPVLIPLALLIAFLSLSGLGLRQRPIPKENALTPLQTHMRGCFEESWIEGDELATLEALTLGYRDDLSAPLRRHFQSAGAMHILAVSGMHTGILFAIFYWILTLGGRRKPMYEDRVGQVALCVVLLAIMWTYACITGLSPSVVRSVIMLSVGQLAVLLRRPAWSLNTLFIAAFLILLFRPVELYSLGFWLSFVAVFGLMALPSPSIRITTPITRPIHYVTSLLMASILAQIATLPLCLYAFGQFSTYFLLTNLLVIPLATAILFVAIIFFAVQWLPLTSLIVAKILTALTYLLNHSVAWIESLPGSVIESRISFTEMLLLYTFLLVMTVLYRRVVCSVLLQCVFSAHRNDITVF